MNEAMKRLITPLLCGAITIFFTNGVWGTELSIPELKATAGESINIPIMIDETDNLAGIKVILEYDAKLLAFEKGARTKYTDSLMHIINDKNPGKLIIVMAGAKGIKGKAFSILTLTFKIKRALSAKLMTQLRITEVELLTDRLTRIECKVKVDPLTILPGSAQSDVIPPKKELPR
jgi:hypothetical protein